MKKTILLLIIVMTTTIVHSQNNEVIRCGTDEIHAQNMTNPDYRIAFEEKTKKVTSYLQQFEGNKLPECNNPLIIPVAVHFQGVGATLDMACAIDMAVDQVNLMNQDFAGTNFDINLWNAAQASTFPGINNKESCIQFCLATLNHPAGFGLNEGDYAVTINQTNGEFDAAWSGYLNFWVRDLGGGILGFSPLGGAGNGDGVACTLSSFGSVSCGGNAISTPFHLGRTMTHEVGHYLLLEHPFTGGCADTDGVADTPATAAASYGCPNLGDVSCTEPILWMSYMDYCDDLCLFMFSEGQVDRMEAYVNTSLQVFINNSVTVCQEAACIGYSVSEIHTDESCDGNDGSINFTVNTGTAPYSYSINNGASFLSTSDFINLNAGVYNIIVKDDSDCEYTKEITILRDEADIELISTENTYCGSHNGAITVEIHEPSVFEYSLNSSAPQDSPVFEGLDAGDYTILATNASGCQGQISTTLFDDNDLEVVVDQKNEVNCFHFDNGSLFFHVKGASEPVEYILDGTHTSSVPIFTDMAEGLHNIYILDNNGCQETFDFELNTAYSLMTDDCPCYIYMPNALSPNDDGVNDYLFINPSCPIVGFEIQIFDRWGTIVYQTKDIDAVWDGGGPGTEYYLIDGLYFYQINYAWGYLNDQTSGKVQTGYINVIR